MSESAGFSMQRDQARQLSSLVSLLTPYGSRLKPRSAVARGSHSTVQVIRYGGPGGLPPCVTNHSLPHCLSNWRRRGGFVSQP